LQEATNTHIEVEYSRATKGFVFTPEDDASKLRITNVPAEASLTGSLVPNTLFGLTTQSTDFTIDSRGRYAAEVIPNGTELLTADSGQQRYGIKVEFLPNTDEGGVGGSFTISSGTTGDTSAIRIENVSDQAKALFGFDSDNPSAVLEVVAEEGSTAVRGVESTAAKVFGKPVSIDPDETFFMDDLSNQFTVTVDSVTETFTLPVGNYNLNSFKTALQNRINAMQDTRGNSISGVVVDFDQTNEIFSFTSGTTGDSSFFQVSGSSRFGLEGVDSSVGSTSTYRPPVSEDTVNGRPIYVTKDENGVFREYSTDTTTGLSELPGSREFTTDPEYRPLFLDKGELTFDTSGNLISPLAGISLDNVVIGGSGNTLNIDIDYSGSTQFSGDFSVNQQSQNGQPNGSLVSVDIADDGLVTASYSNGTQDLKGKIVLATFSTPNGLRQLGDSTFLESNESGTPTLGEPGGAGFGTIRAGARERANVDLTSELVDLITAQRNFQANAKAIETSSTLTSTIINIRS
jgi:flagellar hook protein FlgE